MSKSAPRVAARTVRRVRSILTQSLHLPGERASRRQAARPGAAPGIDHLPTLDTPPEPGEVHLQRIDYGPDRVQVDTLDDMEALEALIRSPRASGAAVRWINVDGLHPYVVARFRRALDIHTLAAEDVLHTPQRPRVEPYPGHVFVVLRMLMLEGEALREEQVSLFLFEDLVVSFQERPGDVWQPIRDRIQTPGTRLRERGAAFLLYSLLDAVVDHAFPLLERYGEVLERTEEEIMGDPNPQLLAQLQASRREITAIRRVMWPTRELVDALQREELPIITEALRPYLRDVYTHAIQIIDLLESYRETCGALTELYLSMVSNRMNEVMKVLTIMASLFIPVTFLAGVYGMNFEYLPELKWRLAYPVFWGVCLTMVTSLLIYFRRKRWL
jgi:magnesium transporter